MAVADTFDRVQDQCSMTHWWPRLKGTGVPVPETVEIGAEKMEVEDASEAEGGFSVMIADAEEVSEAVREVGGPPAFLRSDQMSAKHRMAKASKLPTDDPDELGQYLWRVAEEQKMAWGLPEAERYYVREWLDLFHHYTAFTGTPIGAELRYFINDGEVHDAGFYWPEDAIRRPDRDDWRGLHQNLVKVARDASDRIDPYLSDVCDEFDTGYWSVDFALTEDRDWYCIDMARGEFSWHPEGVDQVRSRGDLIEDAEQRGDSA